MIELDQKVWDGLVYEFAKSLSKGRTIEQALMCFIEDYWTELDTLSSKAGLKEDDEEEYLDVCIDRMMKPMWNYVYNLEKQVNTLQSKIVALESYKNQAYGPVKYPNNFYPDVTPIPGNVPRWKIEPHANGYVPNTDFMTTTGYFQTVEEPKYTTEQIDEWSKIRFDDPSVRR